MIVLTASIFFLGSNLSSTPFPNRGNNSPSPYDRHQLATAVGVILVEIQTDAKLVEVVGCGTCSPCLKITIIFSKMSLPDVFLGAKRVKDWII